ncbi:MAG: GIY-YIG nuclease family protein, partial [Chloroflexota bacterium]|nr:GIY-YIG nuclease family protein [Chloroflexota bacterium]
DRLVGGWSVIKDCGTYALVIFLPRAETIRVGALGAFKFPRGYYVYLGSALGGLRGRLARHLRREKTRFWHIDYFIEHARVVDVWTRVGATRLECRWARAALALPNARVVAPRFGASDCKCAAHLVHLAGR